MALGGPDVTRRGPAGTGGLKSEDEASCRFATQTRWRPAHPKGRAPRKGPATAATGRHTDEDVLVVKGRVSGQLTKGIGRQRSMWIEEVSIECFGACRRTRLRGLGPGLIVVLGPNEAGKSTALEFIRSVFFGFKRKNGKANIYESPDGTLRSGWITVRVGSGTALRLTRIEKRGLREGLLTITDQQGNEIGSSWINLLTPGLDRSSYENLFAFDLDGVRRLDQEALRRKILAAALGSATVSPLEISGRLAENLKNIARGPLRGSESLCFVHQRLRKVDARLRELSDRPVQYIRLKEELAALEARREELAQAMGFVQASLHDMNRIIRHEEQWKGLVVVQEELRKLESAHDFPADGVSRLEHTKEKRSGALEELSELEARLERLRDQQAQLAPDETVLLHADTIGSLGHEARRLAGRPAEAENVRGRIFRAGALLADEITGLGRSWTRERVASSDPSLVLEQDIRRCANAWKGHEERIRALTNRHGESLETCQQRRDRIKRINENLELLAASCRGYLGPESLHRLEQWKTHRSRISDLEEKIAEETRRLSQLTLARQELDESLSSLRNDQARVVSPALFWISAALAAIAGGGLIYDAWIIPDFSSYVFAFVGMCLWLCLPLAMRWKIFWERQHKDKIIREIGFRTRQAEQVTREIIRAENSRRTSVRVIEDLRRQCSAIISEVLGDPHAGPNEVMSAEARSRSAEQPMKRRKILEESLHATEEELEIDEARSREIEADLRKNRETFLSFKSDWKSFLSQHGFDDNLDPETTLVFLERLRSARTRLRQLEEEEENHAAITAEWEDFTKEVRSVAHIMGRPVEPHWSPLDQVDRWANERTEARSQLSEKKANEEKAREHEVRLGVLKKRLEEADDQISELMWRAGVSDEESFREKAESHRRYCALSQEISMLTAALMTGLGFSEEDQLSTFMSSVDWNHQRKFASDQEERLASLRKESESLANQSGRLSSAIESLEAEEETESLLQERETLLAKLKRLTRDWATFKVALLLLEKTLKVYEYEKQPKVLEKGSRIFNEITGGRYVKILFPLNGDHVKVQRSDQSILDEQLLSRSTLEQVYLSLRLAHLEVYGPDESIPVMVDDILVNFDADRAARTARLLVDFSERTGTQVLFFTCHAHIAGLFPHSVPRIDLDPREGLNSPSREKEPGEQVRLLLS